MAEPADQARGTSPAPNAQPAAKAEDKPPSSEQKPVAADVNATWGEVLNAMQLAEDAVSKAVQGMADSQDPPILNNLK